MKAQASYPNIRTPYVTYFQASPNHHLFSTPTQPAFRSSLNHTPTHSNLNSLPPTPQVNIIDTQHSPKIRCQQPLQLIQYQKHQRSLQTSQDKENKKKLVTIIPESSRSCERLLQVLNCKSKRHKKVETQNSINGPNIQSYNSDQNEQNIIISQNDVNGIQSSNKILQSENDYLKQKLKHCKSDIAKLKADNKKLEQQILKYKEEKKKLYEILEQKVYQTKNLIENVKQLQSIPKISIDSQQQQKILKDKQQEFSTLKNQLNIQNQKIIQLQKNQLLSIDLRNLIFLQEENAQLKQEIEKLQQSTQPPKEYVLIENNSQPQLVENPSKKNIKQQTKQNVENQIGFYQREAARLNQIIFKK